MKILKRNTQQVFEFILLKKWETLDKSGLYSIHSKKFNRHEAEAMRDHNSHTLKHVDAFMEEFEVMDEHSVELKFQLSYWSCYDLEECWIHVNLRYTCRSHFCLFPNKECSWRIEGPLSPLVLLHIIFPKYNFSKDIVQNINSIR